MVDNTWYAISILIDDHIPRIFLYFFFRLAKIKLIEHYAKRCVWLKKKMKWRRKVNEHVCAIGKPLADLLRESQLNWKGNEELILHSLICQFFLRKCGKSQHCALVIKCNLIYVIHCNNKLFEYQWNNKLSKLFKISNIAVY